MSWIIGFLTFVLVVNCLLLILLVLIQLPKKEAGMGTAFGGGATDALFGAGSGNALTKLTKYSCGVFFGLTLCLSVLNAQSKKDGGSELEDALKQTQQAPVPVVPTNAPISTNLTTISNVLSGAVQSNAPAPVEVPTPAPVEVPTPAPVPPNN